MIDNGRAVLAVDLGGSKALIGVVSPTGEIRSRVLVSSVDLKGRPLELLDRIAAGARQALAEAGTSLTALSAVGVCVPGPLDAARSVVAIAPNLGWSEFPARAELQLRLAGAPVFLENDVRAAALGESRLGAGRGYDSMLAVFVGSGVGGGLVSGGTIHHGAHGSAGEIGHTIIRAGGRRCPCGRFGCLEAYAARDAVHGYIARALAKGQASVIADRLGPDLLGFTSRHLAEAIALGDRVALRAARRSAGYVGIGIGGVVNLVDPAIVVIGGGIAEALGADYVEVAGRWARRQILSEDAQHMPIVASQLGDDAGLLGAALSAFLGAGSLTADAAAAAH